LRWKFQNRENILPFIFICFGHHLTLKTPDFHKEILDALGADQHTGIAAPRGFAKSSLVLFDDAFDIVNKRRRYILKIADSYTQALEHTISLGEELEFNPILKWLYGQIMPNEYPKGDFVTLTGVKVSAKGQGMKIRGLKWKNFRPDKAVIDDVENDIAVENPTSRRQLKRWLKAQVMPALAKGGKINMIGTILHHDSLLANIVNKTDEFKSWRTLKYSAIVGDNSIWPELYSLEKLVAMRDNPEDPNYIGTIEFNREYQNKPASDAEAVIKTSWIRYYDFMPEIKRKVISIDPAISKKDTADFTAIQCWGEGVDGNLYCLESIRKRLSFQEQGAELEAMFNRHPETVRVIIEEIAYQQALREHDKLKSLPVIGIKPSKDKRTRLTVVSKWFEAGQVYFKRTMEEIIDEILNFGASAHDDTVDAMTMCIMDLKTANTVKFDFI